MEEKQKNLNGLNPHYPSWIAQCEETEAPVSLLQNLVRELNAEHGDAMQNYCLIPWESYEDATDNAVITSCNKNTIFHLPMSEGTKQFTLEYPRNVPQEFEDQITILTDLLQENGYPDVEFDFSCIATHATASVKIGCDKKLDRKAKVDCISEIREIIWQRIYYENLNLPSGTCFIIGLVGFSDNENEGSDICLDLRQCYYPGEDQCELDDEFEDFLEAIKDIVREVTEILSTHRIYNPSIAITTATTGDYFDDEYAPRMEE